MKLVMAIICGLVLLVAPVLAAVSPSSCGVAAKPACGRACCCAGHMMSCCAASATGHSQSAPANSSRTIGQNDFSLLALAMFVLLAPLAKVRPQFSFVPALVTVSRVPLYKRNCVQLI